MAWEFQSSSSFPSRGQVADEQDPLPSRGMQPYGANANTLHSNESAQLKNIVVSKDVAEYFLPLKKGFLQALDKEEFSDFVLNAQDAKFKVHRVILKSSCKFFKGMFNSSSGLQEKELVLKKCLGDGMRVILHFLYSGSCQMDLFTAGAVLHIAILLDLDFIAQHLKKYEDRIKVTPHNVHVLYDIKDKLVTNFPNLCQKVLEQKAQSDLLRTKSLLAFVCNSNSGKTEKVALRAKATGELSCLTELDMGASGELAACMVKDMVFIAGMGDDKSKIFQCDTSAPFVSLQECGKLKQNRIAHSMASVNGKVYIFGGRIPGSDKVLQSIEMFDPQTRETKKIGDVPYFFDSACCSVIDSQVVLFGGRQSNKGYQLNNVYSFDTATKTGKVLRGLPKTVAHLVSITVGRKVILLGQNLSFLYDLDTETCEELQAFKTRVSFFGVLSDNNEIIIIGGRKSFSPRVVTDQISQASIEDILIGRATGWRQIGTLPREVQFYPSQCQTFLNLVG